MGGIENTFQELKDGYKETKYFIFGGDKEKEKKTVVGGTAEKMTMARTQTEASKLKKDMGKTETPSSKGDNTEVAAENNSLKLDSTKQAVTEIERIFQTEVFDTADFKKKDSWFCSATKKEKAERLQHNIGEIISEAKTALGTIHNDAELQGNGGIKKVYEKAAKDINDNGTDLENNFPGVRDKIIAQLKIIEVSTYVQNGEQPTVTIAVQSHISADTEQSGDIQKKVEGFLAGPLGIKPDSWMTKGIIGFLGAIGLFKAGSWLSDIFDWISKPLDSMKKKATEMWGSPLKWIEGKWDEATTWAKGIFGLDSVPLGTIATEGKTYKNDKLKISMDVMSKSLTLDGIPYELGMSGGTAISTLSFEKGDDKTGDYAVINGQKIPIVALKKRIEENKGSDSAIVFAENFEGNTSLVLSKKV